jgi:hypothetical protein
MREKSVRSGREGGMTGIEGPKNAVETQLRGLCSPESRASDQNVQAIGKVAAVNGEKAVAVEIRKTLRL